jgi:type IV pilus assembly protein PilA
MKQNGFTLLELVVVVAIVGILAALAIANYSVFKTNAYNTTAAVDCRNIMPAADFASSNPTVPNINITLDGSGGPVDQVNLPGASSSPGTFGTIDVQKDPAQYQVKTYSARGDLCYSVTNGGPMLITAGVCT